MSNIVTIEPDITIVDSLGNEWVSDGSVVAATNNEVLLFYPDDASRFLAALGPQRNTAFRNDYALPAEAITLKISRLTMGGQQVIAIGSARKECRWDRCELDLTIDLLTQGKIRSCSAVQMEFSDPAFPRELARVMKKIFSGTRAPGALSADLNRAADVIEVSRFEL